jgi:hypothetical protein
MTEIGPLRLDLAPGGNQQGVSIQDTCRKSAARAKELEDSRGMPETLPWQGAIRTLVHRLKSDYGLHTGREGVL